jgi:Mn2+/Fe2+ NRAMP family transporter
MIGKFFKSLGPGLITASVVIGPGSIVTASKAGAHFGYSLVWLLASASIFMAAYTLMAARLGCVSDKSVLTLAAENYGRPVAIVVGVSCFLVVAGFQFGNNLGLATAMEGMTGVSGSWWPFVFTLVAMALMFGAKHLYQVLERLMKVLVGIMVVSFVANLFYTGIDLVGFAKGFVPSFPEESMGVARALFPTTFTVVAAIYAAHLVQEKRWKGRDSGTAAKDVVVGVLTLCFITMTILCGAAGAFHGTESPPLNDASELAMALEGLFGGFSKFVFCLGLAAASFSSFVVNAMIGGGMLADGLGMDRSFDKWPVKAFTSAALLIGMGVAVVLLTTGFKPVPSILLAQASTLLAVPICAVLLLLLANNKQIMGEQRNGVLLNAIGGIGLCVLLWMMWNTLWTIWGTLEKWMA